MRPIKFNSFFVILLFRSAVFLKILRFHMSIEGISYASPKTAKASKNDSSTSFSFCGSFKETSVNGNSFFTFYGKDMKPWLGLSMWPSKAQDHLTIWFRVRSTWKKVQDLNIYHLNFWTHVCFSVDMKLMEIKASINGEKTGKIKAEELLIEAPHNLENSLVIGKSYQEDGPRQFVGYITNVMLLRDNDNIDIKEMSKNLCSYSDPWEDSEWNINGQVEKMVDDEQKICRERRTYQVVLPINMSWVDGREMCMKFGSGNMAEVRDEEDLEYIVNNYHKLSGECERIWTPLTDEISEGIYQSATTGNIPSYLPWDIMEPNGLENQNYVALHVDSKKYRDLSLKYHKSCVACDLDIGTTFYLFGLCEESFFDSLYFLNNDQNQLEYRGIHTKIRYQLIV